MCYSYACWDMYNPQLTGSDFFSHHMSSEWMESIIIMTTYSKNTVKLYYDPGDSFRVIP